MIRVFFLLLFAIPGALRAQESAAASDARDIVTAASAQIGQTVGYDPAYRKLEYPGGDVAPETGVCTDVVIRALRKSRSLDPQQRVHEDMKADFAAYPALWSLKRPDRNIDHRRVPNLQTYFTRQGWKLPLADSNASTADFQPGDIVTCRVPPNRPHIMIVSSRRNPRGVPLVIHNIGSGTREEDHLRTFPLTGHYRLPAVLP